MFYKFPGFPKPYDLRNDINFLVGLQILVVEMLLLMGMNKKCILGGYVLRFNHRSGITHLC